MAISTYGITLKWGATAGNVTKVVDIKDYPDLGGPPSTLAATTLSDPAEVFVLGIQKTGSQEFTCNYTKTAFEAAENDAETSLYYQLSFGTDGSEGVFQWQGQHSVYPVGAGVDAVPEFKIVVVPSTKPTLQA